MSLLLAAPRANASAKEKVAVLVLGSSPADGELADNVTEVVIARIAERGDFEIVGTPEIRRRAAGLDAGGVECTGEVDCLTRAALTLGARRAVVGSIEARDQQFRLGLALRDLASTQEEAHVERVVEGVVGDLVRAAQEATDDLFSPPAAPTVTSPAPAPSPPAPALPAAPWPADAMAARSPFLTAAPVSRPGEGKQWPRYAFYGSGIASVGALTVGLVFGGIAQQPIGASSTRAAAQRDFASRRAFGLVADIGLFSSAALAVLSGYLFVAHRDVILDR